MDQVTYADVRAAIAETTNAEFIIVSIEAGSIVVVVDFIFESATDAELFHEEAEEVLESISVLGVTAELEIDDVADPDVNDDVIEDLEDSSAYLGLTLSMITAFTMM